MLEQRGFEPITKIFLAPLLPSAAGNRRRSNKRKTYTDGWVEFASKKTAKICAETLNAHIVGGRKGGWYHDDVWNMKYLRGFKWTDLMEQVQRERSEREARQRIEDSRAKKEEKMFVAGVESGRVADGMARKNEEKARRRLEAEAEKGEEVLQKKIAQPVRRRFQQSEVVQGSKEGAVADDAKRVLGKIF
jgi:ESF2/ABP1 family protein